MTLNYIGSKKTLLPFLDYVIFSNIEPNLQNLTFGDLFSGTGVVGDYFSKKGFSVISNDTEKYAYVVNRASLKSSYSNKLKKLIDSFNEMEGVNGLLHKHYSPHGDRMFFTEENAKKADVIRIRIENLRESKDINENEYYFLLASLIQSLDKVANTTSVYGAFLKQFKTSASKSLIIIPIHQLKNINKNKVYKSDILDEKSVLLKSTEKIDVIYLDPPYVPRQYGANYCPLNFLVEYNENIEIRGKTGLYDYYKSPFASKTKAKKGFEDMFEILTLKCDNIFLSYNDSGILSLDEMVNIMKKYGDVTTYKYSYKKFQAVKSRGGDTVEYIHYLKCRNDKNKEHKDQQSSYSIKQIQVTKNKDKFII
jgi:adenine-specific DNA-methyltransferase